MREKDREAQIKELENILYVLEWCEEERDEDYIAEIESKLEKLKKKKKKSKWTR